MYSRPENKIVAKKPTTSLSVVLMGVMVGLIISVIVLMMMIMEQNKQMNASLESIAQIQPALTFPGRPTDKQSYWAGMYDMAGIVRTEALNGLGFDVDDLRDGPGEPGTLTYPNFLLEKE